MIECTDVFWQHFYKGAGVTLGFVLPVLLGFGALILTGMRLQQRHEAAMQEARLRAEPGRASGYRVIPGGQG
jgi:hypothetical protein